MKSSSSSPCFYSPATQDKEATVRHCIPIGSALAGELRHEWGSTHPSLSGPKGSRPDAGEEKEMVTIQQLAPHNILSMRMFQQYVAIAGPGASRQYGRRVERTLWGNPTARHSGGGKLVEDFSELGETTNFGAQISKTYAK